MGILARRNSVGQECPTYIIDFDNGQEFRRHNGLRTSYPGETSMRRGLARAARGKSTLKTPLVSFA